jgi:hypothetical protein
MNFITDETLAEFGDISTLSGKASALVEQQKATWETAATNYASLRETENRHFSFGHFNLVCQHNPGRIRSSSADTSAHAILSRPCFLCETNRPSVQKGILWEDSFVILTNPYPIFPVHLTIPSLLHLPQQIEGNLENMLQLSRDLGNFTLFYNGPRCGASAPDHFHFQACPGNTLPVETDLEMMAGKEGRQLIRHKDLDIKAIDTDFRRFLLFRSGTPALLVKWMNLAIDLMRKEEAEEPMLNLLSFYRKGLWNLLLFPREKQRPSHYYESDPGKLLISPAAVELSGLVILPRKEDYLKITPKQLMEVFEEVSIRKKDFRIIADKLIAFN